nr:MAG TPA: TYPE 2A PHOSPHATASE-ASSOCIATED PROTEIN 42, SIGNAL TRANSDUCTION INHIBITOR, HYDROLASE.8A [Bacteriophage sp.]
MSLLSSFSSDFNRDMEIFSTNEEIDSLGQRKLKYQKT